LTSLVEADYIDDREDEGRERAQDDCAIHPPRERKSFLKNDRLPVPVEPPGFFVDLEIVEFGLADTADRRTLPTLAVL